MWETIEVSVGPAKHRGRFRLEGRQLILEWRGGRITMHCGWAKPEVVAAARLQKLANRAPLAA